MDDRILLKRGLVAEKVEVKTEFDILEIGLFISLNFLRNDLLEKGANVDLKILRTEAVHFELYELIELVDVEIAEKAKLLKLLNWTEFRRGHFLAVPAQNFN